MHPPTYGGAAVVQERCVAAKKISCKYPINGCNGYHNGCHVAHCHNGAVPAAAVGTAVGAAALGRALGRLWSFV